MKLIGIMGAHGSGKSTAAKLLEAHYGYRRVRMADPLKRMMRAAGLTYEQVDGNSKEVPAPILDGATPRWAMQSLGTEWGRKLISPDIWVTLVQADMVRLSSTGEATKFVVDDIRFPNEVKMIRELGGELWIVRRPEVEPDMRRHIMALRAVRAFVEALPGMRWNCRLCEWLNLPKPIHSSELFWKVVADSGAAHHTLVNIGSPDDLAALVHKTMLGRGVDLVSDPSVFDLVEVKA